ncbi:fatty acid cis/trans isomerase [Gimesia panareensis]|uniref:Fatty acid cis/trans isomerase (CTI) n=1 Tax=Gimesia panareensis TaxID=2527978 RepID=A0A518A828_9PLAN|nr:fatty acid cis/trans isomerase [Gimesia panareensis]QDT28024.1 Fatty acid cis/trans isomerase (CTI) [Gimesia panareensis]QDU50890.1 Fatty acid cis/trans isomerase (CTI) [Gimesia panareensis]
MNNKNRFIGVVLLLLLIAGAIGGAILWQQVEQQSAWQPFVLTPNTYPDSTGSHIDGNFYLDKIQPIFNKRCIVCHGCLDSPCLLKLTCYEGLLRGARKGNPDGTHLFAEKPVRLYDQPSLAAWREQGFCSVVEQQGPPEERPGKSILFRMLVAGTEHNQPPFDLKSLEPVYQSINKHICPCEQGIDAYLKQRPTAGMPFGMPALSADENQLFSEWITAGSPGPTADAMAKLQKLAHPEVIARWEAFLNQEAKLSPLVSRFIFEHTFLATLHFEESPGEYFRLVRSTTPPIQTKTDEGGKQVVIPNPIHEIKTARPYDTPYLKGVDKIYYRLKKVTETRVQKSLFIWQLSDAKLKRLDELFFQVEPVTGKSLTPGYDSHNPFEVFQAIPARSRAQFLVENSHLIVSGMIRGPVCVGNLATYAIKDNFWVFFVDPAHDPSVLKPDLGLQSWDEFMDYGVVGNTKYSEAYVRTLNQYKPTGYGIEDLWDGNQQNSNAWLTILRNETNATVLRGRQGGIPPTFWLIDYSGFERLYYSLVVNYQYYGSVAQKLATWQFMSHLRQEFEDNFLRLLPVDDRQKYRDLWTRGIGQSLIFRMPFPGEKAGQGLDVTGPDPISGVLSQIQHRFTQAVSGPPDLLNTGDKPDVKLADPVSDFEGWEAAVSTLTMRTQLKFTQFMPSTTFVRVTKGGEHRVYSLVANRSYAFNNVVFDENGARQPELDTMSVYRGLVGDFPNLIIDLKIKDVAAFLTELNDVSTPEKWTAWKNRYGTHRNTAAFWPMLDWLTDWNFQNRQPDAGYFDLKYYMLLDSKY